MRFSPKREQAPVQDTKEAISQEEVTVLIQRELKNVMNAALGKYGTGNMYAAGDMMYDVLFANSADGDRRSGAYPIDEEVMNPERVAPSRDEFIAWFREALVHDPEFQKACEFPGAVEAVDQMIEAGPTIIWTEGDTRNAVGDAPGSGEQLEKMRGMGVLKLGVDKALADLAMVGTRQHDSDPGEELLEEAMDKLIVPEASESKFSADAVNRVIEHLRAQGVKSAVVLDDRAGNSQRMRDILQQNGFDARAIWVKQGRHGRKDSAHDGLEAATIVDAGNLITELRAEVGEPIGVVCDLDGVLADQEKRERLQAKILYSKANQSNWLR